MVNKKFWLGILVLALVFSLTVVGCDNGNNGNDNNEPKWEVLNVPIGFSGRLYGSITFSYEGKYVTLYKSSSSLEGEWTGNDTKITLTFGNGANASMDNNGNILYYSFYDFTMQVKDGDSWVNYIKGTVRPSNFSKGPTGMLMPDSCDFSFTVTHKWDDGKSSNSGGSNIPAALVGVWVSKIGNAMSFEIKADGGCVFPGGATAAAGSVSVSGNTVTVSVTGGSGSFNYSINGNQLTMSNATGLFSGLDSTIHNPYTRN
jgi:hypothetical protein